MAKQKVPFANPWSCLLNLLIKSKTGFTALLYLFNLILLYNNDPVISCGVGRSHWGTYTQVSNLMHSIFYANGAGLSRLQPRGTGRLFVLTMNKAKKSIDYDRVGRCTKYSVNGEICVEYEYRNGHLTDVIRKDVTGNELYRHQYTGIDCEEKVTESALINGLGTETMSWDQMGRVSQIATPYWQETIPDGGYDAAGNIHQTLVHDSVGDISYRYAYDNLYQLIHEEGVFGDNYSYDSINNRLQKNDAPQYVNSLNQLLSDSATAYSYNQNGNLIEMTQNDVHLTLFYDALDRLVAIERPTVFRVEFCYDSLQRRLIQKRCCKIC